LAGVSLLHDESLLMVTARAEKSGSGPIAPGHDRCHHSSAWRYADQRSCTAFLDRYAMAALKWQL
jgi:hypothetical protein